MANRKAAEKFIFEFLKDIEPTGYNISQYEKIFADMSDKDFHNYMTAIRDGKAFLVIFRPMYKAKGITTQNNLAIAKKYGLNFFEKLVFTNDPKVPDYKTPIEFLVIDMPNRRQSQTLLKKTSIPENNKVIDELTYQPTGDSKGAKISYPELQVMIGMGLDNCISELTQYRGGDRGGFNAYNSMFMRYGNANLGTLSQYATGVESTKTLKSYLLGMHINNTI